MSDAEWLIRHKQPVFAWLLGRADCLDQTDKRRIIPGQTVYSDPTVPLGGGTGISSYRLGESGGLYACRQLTDCLPRFWGMQIWRVRLHGEVMEGRQELCATRRTTAWGMDGGDIITTFGLDCVRKLLSVLPVPMPGIVAHCLRAKVDDSDILRALETMRPVVHEGLRLSPDAYWVNADAAPWLGMDSENPHFSNPVVLVNYATFCALQAAAFRPSSEYAAARWVMGALIARLKVLAAVRAASMGLDVKKAYWHEHDIANAELEAEVWKAAYAHGLTTPDAEQN